MSPEKTSSETTSPNKQSAHKSKPKRTRKRAPVFIALAVALTLLAYGGTQIFHWWQKTQVKTPVSTNYDLSVPSETPISIHDPEPFSYEPKDAKKIAIPSLNISGYIQKVGVRKNNSVGVPSNIHIAGWFTQSVLPGAQGLSLLDGHVRGTYNPGIFENLGNVKKDDRIVITFGDNSEKTFAVVSVASLSLEKANQAMLKHDPKISHELHLITCTGTYDEKLKTYSERVLVVARLIDEAPKK